MDRPVAIAGRFSDKLEGTGIPRCDELPVARRGGCESRADQFTVPAVACSDLLATFMTKHSSEKERKKTASKAPCHPDE